MTDEQMKEYYETRKKVVDFYRPFIFSGNLVDYENKKFDMTVFFIQPVKDYTIEFRKPTNEDELQDMIDNVYDGAPICLDYIYGEYSNDDEAIDEAMELIYNALDKHSFVDFYNFVLERRVNK